MLPNICLIYILPALAAKTHIDLILSNHTYWNYQNIKRLNFGWERNRKRKPFNCCYLTRRPQILSKNLVKCYKYSVILFAINIISMNVSSVELELLQDVNYILFCPQKGAGRGSVVQGNSWWEGGNTWSNHTYYHWSLFSIKVWEHWKTH